MSRFLAASPLADEISGNVVALDAQESHHAFHVLRLQPGDSIQVFDGKGYSATAVLRSVGRGHNEVVLAELCGPAPRPTPRIRLACAITKGNRLDWLIEKATELGVDEFLPVHFARSVAGGDILTPGKNARWQGHIVAAAKQCGRDYLPVLIDYTTPAALRERALGMFALLGCPESDTPGIASVIAQAPRGIEIMLIIGPEGGLTDDERRMLTEAGVHPVRLGANILRTETAAIALLAATIAAAR